MLKPTRSKSSRSKNKNRIARLEHLEDRRLLTVDFSEFIDPNPSPDNGFGDQVVALSNGNVAIAAPLDDAASENAGAVYLFDGATGKLISTVTGASQNDRIGNFGLHALPNGNFVIVSPEWDYGNFTDAGAVTLVNGETGLNGVITDANSLHGFSINDKVGNGGITVLPNSNFLVISPDHDFFTSDTGAVTFINGEFGDPGVIDHINSLTGSNQQDRVGLGGVTVLENGNYVVNSYDWNLDFSSTRVGAVTWGDGTTGVKGYVTASNSLIGSTSNDKVGLSGITPLANGNYVVASQQWDGLTFGNVGAVTWGDGTVGTVGSVSSSNSLVGSSQSDAVGSTEVVALPSGNYVVVSDDWDNNGVSNAGAVTWGNGTTGTFGAVSPTNSLVGSQSNDQVGSDGVAILSNGHYVVLSDSWANGSNNNAGAVTWADGSGGTVGPVTTANSLVGTQQNDGVGSNGATPLPNGNYVVGSSVWDNGSIINAGAATYVDGSQSYSGVVSVANSLVGTSQSDRIGIRIIPLTNGNYVSYSGSWDRVVTQNNSPLTFFDAGAVTWGDGTNGTFGEVSEANSLVGAKSNDFSSEYVTALTNGNYVIHNWQGYRNIETNADDAGQFALVDGNGPQTGLIDNSISVVGTQDDDSVGFEVIPLDNGNFLVNSPFWDRGGISNAGAVTYASGTAQTSGTIDPVSSLLGELTNTTTSSIVIDPVNDTFIVSFPTENRVRVGSLSLGPLNDFGDAPASYPTELDNNAAVHRLLGLRLGDSRDAEIDGQPTSDATGDGSDEDGVTFLSTLLVGNTIEVELNVQTHRQAASLMRGLISIKMVIGTTLASKFSFKNQSGPASTA